MWLGSISKIASAKFQDLNLPVCDQHLQSFNGDRSVLSHLTSRRGIPHHLRLLSRCTSNQSVFALSSFLRRTFSISIETARIILSFEKNIYFRFSSSSQLNALFLFICIINHPKALYLCCLTLSAMDATEILKIRENL